jgi:hypothetical protein
MKTWERITILMIVLIGAASMIATVNWIILRPDDPPYWCWKETLDYAKSGLVWPARRTENGWECNMMDAP